MISRKKNPFSEKGLFNHLKLPLNRTVLVLSAILLMIAILPRFFFPGHDISPNGVDEGIQIMAGRMMGYGYDLYDQINSVQPPGMLLVYGLIDNSPSFFRVLSSIASILIIGLVMFASSKAGGWKSMIASGSFLMIDIMFLLESRLASLDMFCLFWSVLGVALLIGYRETGHRGLLAISGLMIGISSMIKLFGVITFGAVGVVLLLDYLKYRWGSKPILSAIILPRRGGHHIRFSDLFVYSLGFFAVIIGIMMHFGPMEVINSTIFNQMHRPIAPFPMKVSQFLKYSLPVVPTMFFFFIGVKDLYKRREGVVVIIGPIFLVYFLMQAMTFDHHLIFLSPMLALGAGLGTKRFLNRLSKFGHPGLMTFARIAPVLLIIAASSVGSGLILHVHFRGEPAQEKIARYIEEITLPDDFIISGDPLIPALANRKVPPSIVNVAKIQYPDITSEQLNRSVIEYGVKVVILTYHLSEMEGFNLFVNDYFNLRAQIADRQNPVYEDTVYYKIFIIKDSSELFLSPNWGSENVIQN